MEFVGDGVDNLSADFRIGIDVMTTEQHVYHLYGKLIIR